MVFKPRKKIITSRRKQRGNIVFTTGLPPQTMEPVAGDLGPGWSLIKEYKATDGDLDNIVTAFGGAANQIGNLNFVWKQDGTKLILGSAINDTVKTFTCSTPFNPTTATESSSMAFNNPIILGVNAAGTMFYSTVFTVNGVWNFPIDNFEMTGDAFTSFASTAELGSSGTIGNLALPRDFSFMYIEVIDGGDALNYITMPNGDLDDITIVDTHIDNGLDVALNKFWSPLTADNKFWWQAGGFQTGVRGFELATEKDVTTLTLGGLQSTAALSNLLPLAVWFNPLDTREIWLMGDGANLRMVHIATNVPES